MTDVPSHFTSPPLSLLESRFPPRPRPLYCSRPCTCRSDADDEDLLSVSPQITRNHYQNALMAYRMDTSPHTPDPLDPGAKGRPPGPEARSHSIALPLTHMHTRMGLARLAHLHPHLSLCNTSQLNERNRIVRK